MVWLDDRVDCLLHKRCDNATEAANNANAGRTMRNISIKGG